jgi:hypothetical protein
MRHSISLAGAVQRHFFAIVGAVAGVVGVIATIGVLFGGGGTGAGRPVTTGGRPPPPPPPPRSLLDDVDQVVQELPKANIVFTAPETLRLGRSTRIQLLLSAQESIGQLKKKLTALGKQEGARIRVSDRMQAHLAGLGFKVEPLTPELQAVSSVAPTNWRWEVEATEPGTQHLTLSVSAWIRVEGESTPLVVQTFEKTLTIRVTLYERVKRFVSHNWQWLWIVLVAPTGSFLFAKYKRRQRARRRQKAKASTPPSSPKTKKSKPKPTKQKTGPGGGNSLS